MTPRKFGGETIRILKERDEARAERDALRLLLARALSYMQEVEWADIGFAKGAEQNMAEIKRRLEE